MSVSQAHLQNGDTRAPASQRYWGQNKQVHLAAWNSTGQRYAHLSLSPCGPETLQKEDTVWQPTWGGLAHPHTGLIFLNRPTATGTGGFHQPVLQVPPHLSHEIGDTLSLIFRGKHCGLERPAVTQPVHGRDVLGSQPPCAILELSAPLQMAERDAQGTLLWGVLRSASTQS